MLSVPPKGLSDGTLQLHATTVAVGNNAMAFVGPGGAGKSSLALKLMSLGATLVADDVTLLTGSDGQVTAHCPPSIRNRIEARGLGILYADMAPATPLHTVVDMGRVEPDRIPAPKTIDLLGFRIPLLHKCATPYFAEGLFHYITYGIHASRDRGT